MDQVRWKNVIEAFGTFAIAASLVFLGLQVQQDHQIARAELIAQVAERASLINEISTRPEFSDSWVKMIENPDGLSTSEISQLNGFLQLVKESFTLNCLLVEIGIFSDCESFVRPRITRYFGNSFAKSWWSKNLGAGPLEWANEVIAETEAIQELQ